MLLALQIDLSSSERGIPFSTAATRRVLRNGSGAYLGGGGCFGLLLTLAFTRTVTSPKAV